MAIPRGSETAKVIAHATIRSNICILVSPVKCGDAPDGTSLGGLFDDGFQGDDGFCEVFSPDDFALHRAIEDNEVPLIVPLV